MSKNIQVVTPLDEVTETTTSDAVKCQGAKRIAFLFTRADHAGGNSAFKVQLSLDGTTYVDCALLVDNANNNKDEGLARITTKTLSADGSDFCYLELQDLVIDSFKIVVTETDDGTHTAKSIIEF